MKPDTGKGNPYALRPWQALDAMRMGMKNPDDTKQAARMVEAVQGRAPLRMLRRIKRTPQGRKLLADKPDLLSALKDAQWLSSLPEGTLGRAYYEFCKKENLKMRSVHPGSPDWINSKPFA